MSPSQLGLIVQERAEEDRKSVIEIRNMLRKEDFSQEHLNRIMFFNNEHIKSQKRDGFTKFRALTVLNEAIELRIKEISK